ncbi:MAG: hypothetical protein F6K25_30650 [Okeania sp. SIO2G4]|uniref:hypothetical protein n=1 Tax=unclassified Okeania TaxID=2634635 RepID=UPI0013B947AB|nr:MULTISPECIES: hypothetical protein [unclassified Okeania]NEP04860.1 hypothetical protein [Okeania sp. SIO4D6]NEP39575.1 hypothetical protein [Okeania sp. SIO2H7]NEP75028.1 hypothetical protein [Okeania sp. SIO2G5]NEP96112.1 hypothetical protein [Okeania sp. SIO2F5]NEQ94757.1 hypothetical protein [Okeania sp. SIO2G4]
MPNSSIIHLFLEEEGRRKKEEGKLAASNTIGNYEKIVNLLFLKEEGRKKIAWLNYRKI